MEFLAGFLLGVITTLVTAPLIIKWWIRRKINKITGGLFK